MAHCGAHGCGRRAYLVDPSGSGPIQPRYCSIGCHVILTASGKGAKGTKKRRREEEEETARDVPDIKRKPKVRDIMRDRVVQLLDLTLATEWSDIKGKQQFAPERPWALYAGIDGIDRFDWKYEKRLTQAIRQILDGETIAEKAWLVERVVHEVDRIMADRFVRQFFAPSRYDRDTLRHALTNLLPGAEFPWELETPELLSVTEMLEAVEDFDGAPFRTYLADSPLDFIGAWDIYWKPLLAESPPSGQRRVDLDHAIVMRMWYTNSGNEAIIGARVLREKLVDHGITNVIDFDVLLAVTMAGKTENAIRAAIYPLMLFSGMNGDPHSHLTCLVRTQAFYPTDLPKTTMDMSIPYHHMRGRITLYELLLSDFLSRVEHAHGDMIVSDGRGRMKADEEPYPNTVEAAASALRRVEGTLYVFGNVLPTPIAGARRHEKLRSVGSIIFKAAGEIRRATEAGAPSETLGHVVGSHWVFPALTTIAETLTVHNLPLAYLPEPILENAPTYRASSISIDDIFPAYPRGKMNGSVIFPKTTVLTAIEFPLVLPDVHITFGRMLGSDASIEVGMKDSSVILDLSVDRLESADLSGIASVVSIGVMLKRVGNLYIALIPGDNNIDRAQRTQALDALVSVDGDFVYLDDLKWRPDPDGDARPGAAPRFMRRPERGLIVQGGFYLIGKHDYVIYEEGPLNITAGRITIETSERNAVGGIAQYVDGYLPLADIPKPGSIHDVIAGEAIPPNSLLLRTR